MFQDPNVVSSKQEEDDIAKVQNYDGYLYDTVYLPVYGISYRCCTLRVHYITGMSPFTGT
jgi:hypothetical protein